MKDKNAQFAEQISKRQRHSPNFKFNLIIYYILHLGQKWIWTIFINSDPHILKYQSLQVQNASKCSDIYFSKYA